MHGDQGGEGIHKELNKLYRVMAGIRDPLKKLLATVKEHIVATDPNVHRKFPKSKRDNYRNSN